MNERDACFRDRHMSLVNARMGGSCMYWTADNPNRTGLAPALQMREVLVGSD